jgi:hypothetical protein
MMTPEEAMSNLPSLFVLPNEINEAENEVANLYFLQKVFQGAFEVGDSVSLLNYVYENDFELIGYHIRLTLSSTLTRVLIISSVSDGRIIMLITNTLLKQLS